jgi:hypothetical protein
LVIQLASLNFKHSPPLTHVIQELVNTTISEHYLAMCWWLTTNTNTIPDGYFCGNLITKGEFLITQAYSKDKHLGYKFKYVYNEYEKYIRRLGVTKIFLSTIHEPHKLKAFGFEHTRYVMVKEIENVD